MLSISVKQIRVLLVVLILPLILNCVASAAQNRKKSTHQSGSSAQQTERAKQEVISAAEDYKNSLRELLVLQESEVKMAEGIVQKRKELFEQSVIDEKDVQESQRMLEISKSKVTDTRIKLAEAELLIKEAGGDERLSSQKKPPYDKAVLLRVVKLNALPIAEIIEALEKRGVNFHLTPEDYDEFSSAGATLGLLKVIASNFRRQ